MFNKLSTKSLVITFGVLLAVVVIFMIYDSKHGERSFRNELVSIDTANVTSIYLYPKATHHAEVKIFKDNGSWKVVLAGKRTADVPYSKVQDLFIQLLGIKPEGVAAQDESKWGEFQVDTAGTRIKVYQGNDETLDMTIGKFTYSQPRNMSTYVRVNGDNNVYVVNGFLEFAFNHNANYFRDDHVINDDYLNWNKLTFTYPADSSFQMIKADGHWSINGKAADSARVARYFESVSRFTDPNFVDDPSQSLLSRAECTLTIQTTSLGVINVSAYEDSSSVVLNSSQFPSTYFDGKKSNLWKQIFVGRNNFFKK